MYSLLLPIQSEMYSSFFCSWLYIINIDYKCILLGINCFIRICIQEQTPFKTLNSNIRSVIEDNFDENLFNVIEFNAKFSINVLMGLISSPMSNILYWNDTHLRNNKGGELLLEILYKLPSV